MRFCDPSSCQHRESFLLLGFEPLDNDNDNDNDTLRKVPHPSNEGLALQARVKGS